MPRGRALGLTAQLPENERHNYPKNYLLGRIDILMGGRSAEKLIFNDTTTGAGNDIEVATNIAKKMVCEWGMSDKIGPLTFGKKDEQVFLGKEMSKSRDFSEDLSKVIDDEVISIVRKAEKNADKLLKKHINHLHTISKILLDRETLTGVEMKTIISNGKLEEVDLDSDNHQKGRRSSKEQ